MKTYRVAYSPDAIEQLDEIYRFIAGRDGPLRAQRYIEYLTEKCDELARVPERGHLRDDLAPGLRTMNAGKRATIAFSVRSDKKLVWIVGIFTGGRNIERYFKRH